VAVEILIMNATQRKQLKDAQKKMIDLDLTSGEIADELGASAVVISQLVNGHRYYPRWADELRRRYGILVPDTRDLRRGPLAKAA
jgi:hypothetical protein